MNLKSAAIAAILTLAGPVAANAITVGQSSPAFATLGTFASGGTFDAGAFDLALGDFEFIINQFQSGDSGQVTFKLFDSSGKPGAVASVDFDTEFGFASVTAQFGSGPALSLVGLNNQAVISTIGNTTATATPLVFVFSGAVGGQAQNITAAISAVPLPASVLLLLGSIAGLGFMSRRKTAIA